MSKRRRYNNTLLPWASAKQDNREKKFIQVGESLILDPRFQALSAGARYTYLAMHLHSSGKRGFEFPKAAAARFGIPDRSLRRYLTELRLAGFIDLRMSGRITRVPNRYEFSLRWKDESLKDKGDGIYRISEPDSQSESEGWSSLVVPK